MDWIETLFHMSPDGGNGTLEVLYIAVLLLIVVTTAISIRHRLKEMFLRYLEQLGKRESGDRFDH